MNFLILKGKKIVLEEISDYIHYFILFFFIKYSPKKKKK